MNNDATSAQQRLELLVRYMIALERGDAAQLATVLGHAEQDAQLERLLLEANARYLDEATYAITPEQVQGTWQRIEALPIVAQVLREDIPGMDQQTKSSSNVQSSPTTSSHDDGLPTLTVPDSDEETATPSYSRAPIPAPRWHDVLHLLESLAAVILVIGVLGGFIALFAVRHLGTPGLTSTSHPIAPGTQLIITGDVNGDISALRPGSGALLWQYQTSGGNAVGSVVTQNGMVFANTEFSVFALQETTGHLLWKVTTGDQGYPGDLNPFFVTGNTLAYTASFEGHSHLQSLVALHASDGALLWKAQVQPNAFDGSLYYIVGSGNGVLFTQCGPLIGCLSAVNATDGKTLWTDDWGTDVIPSSNVEVSGTTAYVVTQQETSPNVRQSVVEALDLQHGALLWQHTADLTYLGQSYLTLDGQTLVVDNPHSICLLRLSDGAQQWCQQILVLFSPVILLDSTMFAPVASSLPASDANLNATDSTTIAALGESHGKLLWTRTITTPVGVATSPGLTAAIYHNTFVGLNHVLFVTTSAGVYALDTSNGHTIWHSLASHDVIVITTG